MIPSDRTETIWKSLSTLQVLTPTTLEENLLIGSNAWQLGDHDCEETNDVELDMLQDEALSKWMQLFLMGEVEDY